MEAVKLLFEVPEELAERVLTRYGKELSFCEAIEVMLRQPDARPGNYVKGDLVKQVLDLVAECDKARSDAIEVGQARSLSLAITHLEDAAMRISPPSWLPYDHNNKRSGR